MAVDNARLAVGDGDEWPGQQPTGIDGYAPDHAGVSDDR
jgi:hypothetical protein